MDMLKCLGGTELMASICFEICQKIRWLDGWRVGGTLTEEASVVEC